MKLTFKTDDGYQLTLLGTRRDPNNPRFVSDSEEQSFEASQPRFVPTYSHLRAEQPHVGGQWVRYPIDCTGEMIPGVLTLETDEESHRFQCYWDCSIAATEHPETIAYIGGSDE